MPTGIYKRTEYHTATYFKKGQPSWNKGIKTPQIQSEKHGNWKGKDVSYVGMHMWVARHLGKPDTCEECGKSGLKGRQIHWANKSGEYKRDLSDWLRLCAKCHMEYDGTYPYLVAPYNQAHGK